MLSSAAMTAPTLDAEPACPGPLEATDRSTPTAAGGTPSRGTTLDLRAMRRPITEIPRETWDALAARSLGKLFP